MTLYVHASTSMFPSDELPQSAVLYVRGQQVILDASFDLFVKLVQ